MKRSFPVDFHHSNIHNVPTIRKVCDVISGDIEAPEPLHGANTRRDGCDVVASHIEHLQTRKESYLCRKKGGVCWL